MTNVGQSERATQNRVLTLFRDELGYRYIGDWTDRLHNSNIDERLLTDWLTKNGHTPEQISRAIYLLFFNGPQRRKFVRDDRRTASEDRPPKKSRCDDNENHLKKIEINERIKKIMKILEIDSRMTTKHEIQHRNLCRNNENHEKSRNQFEN